ncbi:pyridoxamine 5'-phosphate oxidase family protein [Rhodobacter ferrooxidans]|uniref:Pyridoxamine 5'-phosphate oxidase-related FMN-binding protein n=1 Tax=Rhodobacter ferrooxidans TaxID=371731 RepID=C8RY66_9RHOB|nr:pyridoxamine 5'-phosphate oxidase family protein [Rhodobacter sp. SW2]EEW26464.1 pyridoxamine 5'-phosphate oxidase-related FMN-binding protein [Rhodobacter sp. SW2]
MANRFKEFQPEHQAFVEEQAVYFVASTAPSARINLSPKGMDSLRVLGPNRLIWLNLTGSGNETAAHLAHDARMTVMWCSFGARPLILRAFGTARTLHHNDPDWADMLRHFPDLPGARQIFDMTVDLVQTSCGYAVPLMDEVRERPVLRTWTDDKGAQGIKAYWDQTNRTSIDGLPTGIDANLGKPR